MDFTHTFSHGLPSSLHLKALKKWGFSHADFCLQDSYRILLRNSLPKDILLVDDSVFGVDFAYRGVAFDEKFSFGMLGDGAIKVRVKNRRLINGSDFTLAINRNGIAEFFETKSLANFVKMSWGKISKYWVADKPNYSEHLVSLKDFYSTGIQVESSLISRELSTNKNKLKEIKKRFFRKHIKKTKNAFFSNAKQKLNLNETNLGLNEINSELNNLKLNNSKLNETNIQSNENEIELILNSLVNSYPKALSRCLLFDKSWDKKLEEQKENENKINETQLN